MSKETKITYIATVQDNKKLKYGLINHIGEWVVHPKYHNLVKLDFKDYYTIYEGIFYGIIDSDGNVIFNPKFQQIEILNDNFQVTINGKKGLINEKEEYLIQPIYDSIKYYDVENLFHIEIDGKFGLINSEYVGLINPRYNEIYKVDREGFIKVKLEGLYGYINCIDETLIDFKFQLIEDFDEFGYAIAKEKDKYGFINRKGEWIIYPTYDSVSNFNIENFSCVSIDSNYGVINREGKWVIQPKFLDCKTINNNDFIIRQNHKFGIIDINENWIVQPIYKSLSNFDENGFAIASLDDKYGIIDKNFAWVIEPQFNYISDFNEFGQYRIHLSNKMGIIDTKHKGIILEPIFENIIQFPEHNHIFKVFIDSMYGLFDKDGKVLLKAILNKLSPFNEKGIATAQLQKNKKWGIINTSGEWIFHPIYDELENIDEFGYLKATLNGKYGWIDIKGNWIINPVFDIEIYTEVGEEQTNIEYLIEDTLWFSSEDLKSVFFSDKIPDLLKSTFNENLDLEFKENIDYLLLCDDSIEGNGSEGIAIIKRNDYHYLLLKQHRTPIYIVSLDGGNYGNEISSFSLIEDEFCLVAMLESINSNVVDGIIKANYRNFNFYNIAFLKFLIELVERIETEMN